MDDIISGHGEMSSGDLLELRKALEIGFTDPPIGADSLRVESLEATLKVITYQEKHAVLWNMIPKIPATSTIEEFNRLLEYGTRAGNFGFISSGQLPEEEDTTFERASEKVKFVGTTRNVHHPATLVTTVPANLIGEETRNGVRWIIGKMDESMYYADEAVVPEEFNSLEVQISDGGGNVIDLAGGPLTSAVLERAARLVTDNFGQPGDFFTGTKPFADFSEVFIDNQRFAAPNVSSGIVGTPVTGYNSTFGVIKFHPDTFVQANIPPPTAATSIRAPSAPTIAVAEGTPNDPASLFAAGDAGNYGWQISAVNKFGESVPSAIDVPATDPATAAGDSHDIVITDGGGADGATGYVIYRTAKDDAAGATSRIARVGRAKTGGVFTSPTTINDFNETRPFTHIGLMLDFNEQSLRFKQLAPMMKMDLARIAPTIRWMQLLYGTPIVYNPKKNVVFRNIG